MYRRATLGDAVTEAGILDPGQWLQDHLHWWFYDLPKKWGDTINQQIPIASDPALPPDIRAEAKSIIDDTAQLAEMHKKLSGYMAKVGIQKPSLSGLGFIVPALIAAGLVAAMYSIHRLTEAGILRSKANYQRSQAVARVTQDVHDGVITPEQGDKILADIGAAERQEAAREEQEAKKDLDQSGFGWVASSLNGVLKVAAYGLIGFLFIPPLLKKIH